MPRWKASCWLGSKSGFVDLEVTANTSNGAIEQMRNIHGAQIIRNIHQVHSRDGNTSSSDSGSSGGSLLLLGMIAAGMLFVYFTPWVLMIAYGAASTWVAEKLVGQNLREYHDIADGAASRIQHRKATFVLVAALLAGMGGFLHGKAWNAELNEHYNLDGKQAPVAPERGVRPAGPQPGQGNGAAAPSLRSAP